jgi:hypothetical protein
VTSQEPTTEVQERTVVEWGKDNPWRLGAIALAIVLAVSLIIFIADEDEIDAAKVTAYEQGMADGRKIGYAEGRQDCRAEAQSARERVAGNLKGLPNRGECYYDAYEAALNDRLERNRLYDRLNEEQAAEEPVVIVTGNSGAGGVSSICQATPAQLMKLAAQGVEVNKHLDNCCVTGGFGSLELKRIEIVQIQQSG